MKPNPFPPLRVGTAGPAPRFLLLPVDPATCYPLLTTYTGDDNGRERAEYACQAVNSHAGLVGALRNLSRALETPDANASCEAARRELLRLCPEYVGFLNQARAELAKLT